MLTFLIKRCEGSFINERVVVKITENLSRRKKHAKNVQIQKLFYTVNTLASARGVLHRNQAYKTNKKRIKILFIVYVKEVKIKYVHL